MKKYLKLGLKVGISLGLIIYLVSVQDINQIKEGILNFNFWSLIFALILLNIGTYVSALRWKTILATSGKEVDEKYLYVLYLKGYFYNNFLPTQMGGDVYKAVSLGNRIKDQPLALFSVFMDRFGGLIILLTLSLFGIGSLYGAAGLGISILLFITGLALYFPVLNLFGKKVKFLKKFKDASDLFLKDKQRGVMVLVYSLLIQLLSFSLVYVLFMGAGVKLPLWSVFAFMPITSLSLLIPSFNGFGTQDTVYAFLFKFAGVTEALSITVSLMNHVVRLVMSLVGGVLILIL